MPSTTAAYEASRGSLKHVNLMMDTYIANASLPDLRAVIRTLLSTMPSTHAPFTHIARNQLAQAMSKTILPPPSSLFTAVRGGIMIPAVQYKETLSHARMLFGAGMGIESLPILTYLIRATFPLRWSSSETDPLASHLAVLDSDLGQAVQSCREELAAGHGQDIAVAKESLEDLYNALQESKRRVAGWGGEFCFDRAFFAVIDWRRAFI